MLRSWHRSVAVRDYKRPSVELQRNLSCTPQPQPSTASETLSPSRNEAIFYSSGCQKYASHARQVNQTIELNMPDFNNTAVVIKNGRKLSATL